MSANLGPESNKYDPSSRPEHLPALGQIRHKMWPGLGNSDPKSISIGPMSTNFGLASTSVGPTSNNFGQFGPGFARDRPKFGAEVDQVQPEVGQDLSLGGGTMSTLERLLSSVAYSRPSLPAAVPGRRAEGPCLCVCVRAVIGVSARARWRPGEAAGSPRCRVRSRARPPEELEEKPALALQANARGRFTRCWAPAPPPGSVARLREGAQASARWRTPRTWIGVGEILARQ